LNTVSYISIGIKFILSLCTLTKLQLTRRFGQHGN